VLNSFVFNFDSPGKTLGRVVNYEYYGYPRDFIFQYQKAVRSGYESGYSAGGEGVSEA
jgi:hypothetical protein